MKEQESIVSHVKSSKDAGINEFRREVYDVVSQIPKGKVLSYADVATLAGAHHKFGVISFYLSIIPSDMGIPRHRVVSVKGALAPSFPVQRSLLESEGIIMKTDGTVDMKKYRWNYEDIDADLLR